jgi:uncharacterized protein (TIGR00251 family)
LDDGWVTPAPGGCVLRIHVRPGASRAGVTGMHGDAIAVRVSARPVEGAANRELLAIMARALGVGQTALELASGARARDKRVLVHGLSPAVARRKLALLLGV